MDCVEYLSEKQDVVNWFLAKESMRKKKLQCLFYYAHAWTIAVYNECSESIRVKLCPKTAFEAWVHNPCDPTVHSAYSNMCRIPQFEGELPLFTADTNDLLNDIWSVYGAMSGSELSLMARKEAPYRNARGRAPIDEHVRTVIKDQDIFTCYRKRSY